MINAENAWLTVQQDSQEAYSTSLSDIFYQFWSDWVFTQYGEWILLFSWINQHTPGAQPASTYDLTRRFSYSFAGPDHGAGWQAPGVSGQRQGYLDPVLVRAAIDDKATQFTGDEAGRINYTTPMLYVLAPTQLQKFDVVVRDITINPDGTWTAPSGARRCVVGDSVAPGQVFGHTLVVAAELEQRSPIDVTNQIPLD